MNNLHVQTAHFHLRAERTLGMQIVQRNARPNHAIALARLGGAPGGRLSVDRFPQDP